MKKATTLTKIIANTTAPDGVQLLAFAILERAIKDYKQAAKRTDEKARATVREVENFFEGPMARLCCRLLEEGEREISPKEILNRVKSELENSPSRQKQKHKRKEDQNDGRNNDTCRSAIPYNAA